MRGCLSFFKNLGAALTSLLIASNAASAQPPTANWEALTPKNRSFIIRDATFSLKSGKEIKYSVVKIHLGYSDMSIIDTKSFIEGDRKIENGVHISADQKIRIIDYSLSGIAPLIQDENIVLVPAGWSRSLRYMEQIGYLRINGKTIKPIAERFNLSALLCLHDKIEWPKHQYYVPVAFFYDPSRPINRNAIECENVVQVGPRILEEQGKDGISPAEMDTTPYERVVFAVDEQHIKGTNNRSRDMARNAYFLITHNRVHLYEIQEFLKTSILYGKGEAHFAVNLAGGKNSGMIVRVNGKEEKLGYTDTVVGSAFAIREK